MALAHTYHTLWGCQPVTTKMRRPDNKRGTSSSFKIGLLAKLSQVTKLPAVITNEGDDSVVSVTEIVEGINHSAKVSIKLRHCSKVAKPELESHSIGDCRVPACSIARVQWRSAA